MLLLCVTLVWILLQKVLLHIILLSAEWFSISQAVHVAVSSTFLNIKVKKQFLTVSKSCSVSSNIRESMQSSWLKIWSCTDKLTTALGRSCLFTVVKVHLRKVIP